MPRVRKQPKQSYFAPRLLLLVIFWLIGFFWFIEQVPTEPVKANDKLDGVVVLTGGKGRLDEGIQILAQGKASKMLISGVDTRTSLDDLLVNLDPKLIESAKNHRRAITLGYLAQDTKGNAAETAMWAELQGIKSFYLVTGNYHILRSLQEFRHSMPELSIQPIPYIADTIMLDRLLKFPGSLLFLMTEYCKFLALQIHIMLEKWDTYLQ